MLACVTQELKGWQRADISKCNLEYLAVLVDKAKVMV